METQIRPIEPGDYDATAALLNGAERAVPLPPTTLEDVRGTITRAATGKLKAMAQSSAGKLRVTLEPDQNSTLPASSLLQLDGTEDYNGQYVVRAVLVGELRVPLANNTLQLKTPLAEPLAANAVLKVRSRVPVGVVPGQFREDVIDVTVSTDVAAGQTAIPLRQTPPTVTAAADARVTHADLFDIDAPFSGTQLGRWQEVVAPQAAPRPGSIQAVTQAANGRIHLQLPGHGLADGASVEIRRNEPVDGEYKIVERTGSSITLDAPWKSGEVVTLGQPKLGGLNFRSADDFITIPNGAQYDLTGTFTVEAWVKTSQGGAIVSRTSSGAPGDEGAAFFINSAGRLALGMGGVSRGGNFVGTGVVTDGVFHHVAVVYNRSSATFFIDGQPDTTGALLGPIGDVPVPASAGQTLTIAKSHHPAARPFNGTLFDVRIWDRTRTQQEIASARASQLLGREQGLAGLWRLDAILEETTRRVSDFTPNGNHGLVSGDPFASEVELKRRIGSVNAITYDNPEPVALTEGATYEESFEFDIEPAAFDPTAGDPPFQFVYTGRRSRESRAVVGSQAFKPAQEKIASSGGRRFVAKCKFTVPEGASQVRSFGIGNFRGNWEVIRVRKHRIREISGATESFRQETVRIASFISNYETLLHDLTRVRDLEILEGSIRRQIFVTSAALRRQQTDAGASDLAALQAQQEALTKDLLSPLNYRCRLRARFNNSFFEIYAPPERTAIAKMRTTLKDADADSTLRFVPRGTNSDGKPLFEIQSALRATVDQVRDLTGVDPQGGLGQRLRAPFVRSTNPLPLPHLCLDTKAAGGSGLDIQWRPSVNELRTLLSGEAGITAADLAQANLGAESVTQTWLVPLSPTPRAGVVNSDGTVNRGAETHTECLILDRTGQNVLAFNSTQLGVLRPDDADGRMILTPVGDPPAPASRGLLLTMDKLARDQNQAIADPPVKGDPVDAATKNRLVQTEQQLSLVLSQIRARQDMTALMPTLNRLNAALRDVQSSLATTIASLLNTLRTNSNRLELPALPNVGQESPGAGALLGFARPGSRRINLAEFSDGNLALTYLEDANDFLFIDQVVESLRDTVADIVPVPPARNLRRVRRVILDVEGAPAWRFDIVQRSRDLSTPSARLTAPTGAKAILLANEWTIECWFRHPFPSNGDPLTRPLENDPHILVEFSDGSAIGVQEQQFGVFSPPQGAVTAFTGSGLFTSSLPTAWHTLSLVGKNGRLRFVLNAGISGALTDAAFAPPAGTAIRTIGNRQGGGAPFGRLAQIRVWNEALPDDEIEINAMTPTLGFEPGLQAWFPLDANLADGTGVDSALTSEAVTEHVFAAPGVVGGLEQARQIIACDYTTFIEDKRTHERAAMLRSFLAIPTSGGVQLFGQKRVELLELRWIGNGQFAPTLLGYIEGPPPVPSENLTVSPDSYQGATSVTVVQTREVTRSWNRSRDTSIGGKFDFFIGAAGELETGAFGLVSTKVLEFKAGLAGSLATSLRSGASSNISASSATTFTDSLALRGSVEGEARFETLGRRFIPKNVGYALVVSSLADVFVARLLRSKRMVAYQVLPVPDVPPEVNTITFQMNPAYTLNGTLDGLVGSEAADDRFYAQVPELRARFGSLYPASYFRLRDTFDLKAQIEAADKRREAYFQNFDVDINLALGLAIDAVQGVTGIDISRSENPDESETRDVQRKVESAGKTKQSEIEQRVQDPQKRTNASVSFAAWQKRMEDLRIQAGKRNIVNTYVWDADGGLRSESQSVASTVEHTLSSELSLEGDLGFKAEIEVGGFAADLDARFAMSLTETLSKTASQQDALSVDVNLDGVESFGVTDANDRPLLPGEKVDRYRFSTFYLEAATQHFNDFFNQVVDPEWLASNSEEARALRQAQSGKPNKAWRLLHRVTEVERPALRDFGRDARPLTTGDATPPPVEDQIAALVAENAAIKAQLDEILRLLRTPAADAAGAGR